MPDSKRHHYLPVFYQDGFAHAGKLRVYDRELSEYRAQTPKNTGLEQHLNTYVDDEGRTRTIEPELSEIEGRAKAVISKIDVRQSITDSERETLSLFASLFLVRVPVTAKEIAELGDRLHKDFLQRTFSTEEKAQAILDKHPSKSGSQLTAKEIIDFIQRKEYAVVPDHDDLVTSRIPTANALSKDLLTLDWKIVYAPKGEPFVTTDNPFALALSQSIVLKGIPGFDPTSPDSRILVPLSQRACLIINSEGMRGVHAASKRVARQINLKVVENCDRFVIGPDEALLRHLVRQTRVDKLSRTERFRLIDLVTRKAE